MRQKHEGPPRPKSKELLHILRALIDKISSAYSQSPMRAFPLVSSIVSLAFGLVLAFWLKPSFSLELRIAAFSSMWPTVTGTILDVRAFSLGSGGTGATHHALVTFEYDVSGQKYRHSQVLCECTSIVAAEDVLRDFSKGAPVPVFYDPVSPYLSVVQPRGFDAAFLTKWSFEIASVLLFVLVIPISLWVLGAAGTSVDVREAYGGPRLPPLQRGAKTSSLDIRR